jgi:hypothetical protein
LHRSYRERAEGPVIPGERSDRGTTKHYFFNAIRGVQGSVIANAEGSVIPGERSNRGTIKHYFFNAIPAIRRPGDCERVSEAIEEQSNIIF